MRVCVTVSAALFQQFNDSVLQGIPNCAYLDYILAQGKDLEECVKIVDLVLSRLNKFNVRINKSKCKWFEPSVEYLGHIISEKGRSPPLL